MTTLRPMRARDTGEPHRVASTLELLFDLFFVVAVSFASSELHHAISEGHAGSGVVSYLAIFFAIWWAWMNYTWFASAYDTDDWLYRLMTLVQMSGVLVLASGIPRAFEEHDWRIVYTGYVIMRIAMVAQRLRAAKGDPAGRPAALRYAAGICVAQVAWISLLVVPGQWWIPVFVVGMVLELAVPVWAERGRQTPWHPHHIAERYGLFVIIMLGENVLAATMAFQESASEHGLSPGLIGLAASALVIAFSLWWIYFAPETPEILVSNREAIPWGYGHSLIFAAMGSFSAGIEVGVDFKTGKTELSSQGAAMAVAVPLAVFLFLVWLLHIRPHRYGAPDTAAFLAATALVLLATLTPLPVEAIAVVMVALVIVTSATRNRQASMRDMSA